MAKKPIKVTEVVLRDAHQSLLATRMTAINARITSMPFATDFCTKYSTASSA